MRSVVALLLAGAVCICAATSTSDPCDGLKGKKCTNAQCYWVKINGQKHCVSEQKCEYATKKGKCRSMKEQNCAWHNNKCTTFTCDTVTKKGKCPQSKCYWDQNSRTCGNTLKSCSEFTSKKSCKKARSSNKKYCTWEKNDNICQTAPVKYTFKGEFMSGYNTNIFKGGDKIDGYFTLLHPKDASFRIVNSDDREQSASLSNAVNWKINIQSSVAGVGSFWVSGTSGSVTVRTDLGYSTSSTSCTQKTTEDTCTGLCGWYKQKCSMKVYDRLIFTLSPKESTIPNGRSLSYLQIDAMSTPRVNGTSSNNDLLSGPSEKTPMKDLQGSLDYTKATQQLAGRFFLQDDGSDGCTQCYIKYSEVKLST